jgi:hypothetical protein
MDDRDEVSIEQQLADLATLKQVSRRRESLRRGTPEWVAASEAERRAADRIRDWSRPIVRVQLGKAER